LLDPNNPFLRSIRSAQPMTPQQAAHFLELDVKTITRWARKSYIPAHPLGEGKRKFWRFFEHELLDGSVVRRTERSSHDCSSLHV
jgi:hypothetical protein